MPRHKDFEIWYDEERQRYCFSVEYWGGYSAKTLEEIEQKLKRARRDIKARLKEIDRQNKAYYKRLEMKEEQLKRELKEHKSRAKEKNSILLYKDLSAQEQKMLLKMILEGRDELQIKDIIPVNSSTIAALRKRRNENVCRNVQENENVSESSGRRIIMPGYTTKIIGNKRLGD